jgi:hypothetical protein
MLNKFFPLYFKHFVGLLEKHSTAGALWHLNISTICTPLAVKSSKSSTMVMKMISAPLPLSETDIYSLAQAATNIAPTSYPSPVPVLSPVPGPPT